ncbi:hypothetical protein V0288_21785 [Pannus brasiliensis CCIBt3594]|uniref:Uncharacterized protein n=1 Tax=Pannus brasiliensis CCIBt3594 TaxID=1427578 RepID=A0AAW9QX09_9CHRO
MNNGTTQWNLTQIMEMDDNSESFYKATFEILEIISHIEDEIENFPPNKQPAFSKILSTIKEDFIKLIQYKNQQFSSFSRPILLTDYHAINTLTLLAVDYEEYKICLTKEDLTNFRDEILNWIKNIEESSIEENFKKILLIKLNEILNVVNKFYIYGVKGLKKELLATLPELAMSQGDDKYNILKNSIIKFLWNKLSDTFSKVNPVLSGVVNTYKVTEFVSKLLPPGDPQ